ncbi:MAG TPA: class I SAM-dependent methyltransferase [bacterium]|nr:class I SAM-dependent methyltransferase [bacterium]
MAATADPEPRDWARLELPPTWADELDLGSVRGLRRFFRILRGKRRPVELPPGMPGADLIPNYVRQEFHNLPNGNYSRKITRGYSKGFDISMLGVMRRLRRRMAKDLLAAPGRDGLLDVGTGSGRLAAAIHARGGRDVWGLDPSPYLLQHAARSHPEVRFVQGLAEDLPFADERFCGIGVCFVLHEMPPKQVRAALREMHRTLRPAGRLVIVEPSPEQLQPWRLTDVLPLRGWRRVYYRALARRVFEPFVPAWHKLDKVDLLRAAGFEVLDDVHGMPTCRWVARKPSC